MATIQLEEGSRVSVVREGSGRATSMVRVTTRTANSENMGFARMTRIEAEMLITAIRESFK